MKTKLCALTLVELMVTVSIFAILTSISVPLIMQNRSDQAVNSEATLVKEFVLRAKNFAQNPENEAATAYEVKYSTASQIDLVRLIGDVAQPFGESLRLSQSQIETSNFTQPTPIIFKVPNGEIDRAQTEVPISIIIKSLSGGSSVKNVKVTYPGVVNVN